MYNINTNHSLSPKPKLSPFKHALLKAINRIRVKSTRNRNPLSNSLYNDTAPIRARQATHLNRIMVNSTIPNDATDYSQIKQENILLKYRVTQLKAENTQLNDKLRQLSVNMSSTTMEQNALAKLESLTINIAALRKQLEIMRKCNLEYIRTQKSGPIIDSISDAFNILDNSSRWYCESLLQCKYKQLAVMQNEQKAESNNKTSEYLRGLYELVTSFNSKLSVELSRHINDLRMAHANY